ncbi:MAG: ABC transporter ATP-binding protein [Chloroflexota bacterium]
MAIETHGLRKEYGRKVAVANLSLSVPAGEVFGFLGPNGAGKSTTVKMLVGLVRPTAGSGTLLGRPLGDAGARRRLGFLPEQFRFHEWLRAEEFLEFHASLYGVPRRERSRRIAEALHVVGLEARAGDALRTFSKGMLQRIGIAQALIGDPELVILDEPTSALDPIGRRDVRDLIHRLRERGIAVFLNSHLLSEVEMVCDRVAIIDRGVVVRQGPVVELVAGTLEGELRLDEAPPSLLAALETRWPVVACSAAEGTGRWTVRLALQDDADLPEIADLVVRSGARLHALIPHRRTLEDLFVQAVETRDA